MQPRALPFWSDEEVTAAIGPAITHLRSGGLLGYPTETIYGFGGAVDLAGLESLMALKRRPPAKPFLLLIAGSEMLARLDLHLTNAASRLAARFWPGPLTLVLAGGEHRVPIGLRGPEGGVAVRWTSHAALQRLIGAYGDPITSTSANRPGLPPAMAASEIVQQWSDAVARGQLLVLDGGRLTASPPSTVVDCTGRRPRVIRPGAISSTELRGSVPDLIGDV